MAKLNQSSQFPIYVLYSGIMRMQLYTIYKLY